MHMLITTVLSNFYMNFSDNKTVYNYHLMSMKKTVVKTKKTGKSNYNQITFSDFFSGI